MIKKELLDILVCPETKQKLCEMEQIDLNRVNEKIRAGDLENRAGEKIPQELDGALVREDNQFAYPVRQDIPIMLVEESFELSRLRN